MYWTGRQYRYENYKYIYVELGEPLNTQKSIENVRNSIKLSQGFDDCTILYMKRVKVERLNNRILLYRQLSSHGKKI